MNKLPPQPTPPPANASSRRSGHVLDLRPIASRKARQARADQKLLESEAAALFTPSQPAIAAQQKTKSKSLDKVRVAIHRPVQARLSALTTSVGTSVPPRRATPQKHIAAQHQLPPKPSSPHHALQPHPHPDHPSHRTIFGSLIGFMLILLLAVAPATVAQLVSVGQTVTTRVLHQTETAFHHLQLAATAVKQLDVTQAQDEFYNAQSNFLAAQAALGPLQHVAGIAAHLPGKGAELATGIHLLSAGYELSLAGTQGSKLLDLYTSANVTQLASDTEPGGITQLLVATHAALVPTQQHVNNAVKQLDQVSLAAVPADKQSMVTQAKTTLPVLDEQMNQAVTIIELLLGMLGTEREQHYIVLFANNYELRPIGGFPGSIAFISVRDGVVTGLNIPGGGVYDVAGQGRARVISPPPFHLINPNWQLQDALWWPHFPASAQKLEWFLDQSQAPSVDGVIVVTPQVIEKLLTITGPLDMQADYGLTIDEDNFYQQVQVLAEQKYDQTRESKKIIADMTPLLLNKLLTATNTPDRAGTIVSTLKQAVDEKAIVLYLNDPAAQRLVSALDWGGELKHTDRDYLSVVHTNIGAGKTNGVIDETIRHQAAIDSDGTITDTLTVT